MSTQLMVTMLQSGKNAKDILAILDTITATVNSAGDITKPSLDSIEF